DVRRCRVVGTGCGGGGVVRAGAGRTPTSASGAGSEGRAGRGGPGGGVVSSRGARGLPPRPGRSESSRRGGIDERAPRFAGGAGDAGLSARRILGAHGGGISRCGAAVYSGNDRRTVLSGGGAGVFRRDVDVEGDDDRRNCSQSESGSFRRWSDQFSRGIR